MAMSKCSCWGLLTWCWGAVGIERECEMSFREERFCYWLESFTWGYGRLLCPLAARDLLVVVEVDIGGHPATESQGGNIAETIQPLKNTTSHPQYISINILPTAENWGYKYKYKCLVPAQPRWVQATAVVTAWHDNTKCYPQYPLIIELIIGAICNHRTRPQTCKPCSTLLDKIKGAYLGPVLV